MPDRGGVGKALPRGCAKLGVEVLAIDGAPDAEALEATLAEWTAAGPIHGVYWLPALDDEGPLGGLDPAAWREALRVRVKLLAVAMRALAARRQLPRHGHAPRRPPRLRRRRRHLGPRRRGDRLHQGTRARAPRRARQGRRLRAEPQDRGARRPPGRRDAARPGRRRGRPRRRPALDGRAWPKSAAGRRPPRRAAAPTRCSSSPAPPAASSSAITADLAGVRAARSTCSISSPSPTLPTPTSRASPPTATALRRELAERIRERGERPTPKLVERELAGIERARAALDAIEAIARAGGTAHWHQVDLTDHDAVAHVVEQALADSGRIDVLMHAAGARDQPLPARQAPARVRPRLRRQGRRLVQPDARAARRAAAVGDRLQLDRRALRQRRPDRLRRRQRSAVQERFAPAQDRGHARHRHRLDRVGRHRHGHPRLDPEDDGRPPASTCCRRRSASRSCAASSRRPVRAARSSSPAPSACCSPSATRPAGSTPSARRPPPPRTAGR